MASTSVFFDVIARDRASDVFGKVGKSAEKSSSKMVKFGNVLKKGAIAGAAGMAVAGAASAKLGLDSIKAASDLSESVNAVRVSYGKAADDILKLGESSAKSFGLSKSELNGLAVRFSSFSGTVAGKGGDSAKVFEQIASRATDFASVMNLDVADAAEKFQSGLAGETEPLRQFGIDLSAAKVESFAYANGIAEAGEKLSESQKVQARFGALMKQTNKVQGDFANTSGGLANQQRILAANFENVKAKIGQKLLPVAAKLTSWVNNTALPAFERFGGWLQATLPPIFDKVRDVIAKFTGDGSGKFSKFVADIKGIFNDAKTIIAELWAIFGDNILSHAKRMFKAVKQVIGGAFKVIKGIFQVFAGILTGDWKKTWKGIKNILSGAKDILVGIVKALWSTVKFAFANAKSVMTKVMSAAWDGIKALFNKGKDAIISGVKAIPGKIRDVGGKLLEAGKTIMGKLFDGIKAGASAVGGFVSDFASRIASAIKNAANSVLGLPRKITLGGKLGIPEVGFTIPAFHTGGRVFPDGRVVHVADGGEPESILPDSMLRGLLSRSGGGGGVTYVFAPKVTGAVDPVATTRQLEKMFIEYARAKGRPVRVA